MVVKQELREKTKLVVYQSIYVHIPTYDCELRVMTDRAKSQVPAVKLRFFYWAAGLNLPEGVRHSGIWWDLRIELLVMRSQLSRFRHRIQTPPEGTPKQAAPGTFHWVTPAGGWGMCRNPLEGGVCLILF